MCAERSRVFGAGAPDAGPSRRARSWPEAQRVEQGDRPRAHGEDVAHDAADAGRRALVRLDRRGVVVRLDLEHGAVAAADIDRAGVLAAALGQHLRAGAGEEAQQRLAVLVAAVLAPHRAEHAQLDVVRLAVEQRDDLVVLVDGEGDQGQGFSVSGHEDQRRSWP